jgi:hypothetical protein
LIDTVFPTSESDVKIKITGDDERNVCKCSTDAGCNCGLINSVVFCVSEGKYEQVVEGGEIIVCPPAPPSQPLQNKDVIIEGDIAMKALHDPNTNLLWVDSKIMKNSPTWISAATNEAKLEVSKNYCTNHSYSTTDPTRSKSTHPLHLATESEINNLVAAMVVPIIGELPASVSSSYQYAVSNSATKKLKINTTEHSVCTCGNSNCNCSGLDEVAYCVLDNYL